MKTGASILNLDTEGRAASAFASACEPFYGENSITGLTLGTKVEADTLSWGLKVFIAALMSKGCFAGGAIGCLAGTEVLASSVVIVLKLSKFNAT